MTIARYLAAYVRRRRRAAVTRAAGWAVTVSIVTALLACLIDRGLGLPSTVRAGLLAVTVAGPIAYVARPLARWARRSFDPVVAAAAVERHAAAFDHQLVTAASPGDGDLHAAVVTRATDTIAAVGPVPVSRRPAVVAWVVAAATVLVVAGLWRWTWLDLPDLSRRLLHPLRPAAVVTTTRLSVRRGPTSVAEGRPFTVTADRTVGRGPVTLHVSADGRTWVDRRMSPVGPSAYAATVPAVDRDLRYYVTSGDATSAGATVTVRRVPAVVAVRVRYVFPPQTHRPPLSVADAAGEVVAPAGTLAAVDVVATVPLRSAAFTLGGRSIPTTATADERVRRGRFTVSADGTLAVQLTAADGTTAAGPPVAVRVSDGTVDGFEDLQRAYRAAATRP